MKLAAADSARGSGQATNRSTDANGKKVADQYRCKNDHADKGKGLAIEFGDSRIVARLRETALRHHCPIQLRQSAERADHLNRVPFDLLGEAGRCCVA